MSEETPRPPRRKRYSGKNPRRFEDKYKEHDPARYGDTVAKVIASGKTPAGSHIPIMMEECLAALELAAGMTGVDATLGYGGHALRILEKISPGGKLLGLDVDPIEQPKTEARLRAAGYGEDRFEAVRSNYAGISKALASRDIAAVDFVFADLGCSSMQLDDPSRGFSFKTSGPLDMRMNPSRGLSAADWLEKTSVEKLETALVENADEPRAQSLSTALAGGRFQTTSDFARAIREAVRISDEEEMDLTVRRVFQAVRIAVNEEFTALDAFLRALPDCLKSGGRAAILTFHSGEDRRVKQFLKAGVRDGLYSEISEGVVQAGPEERRMNPRSSSAKLRWATRM
ncbi:16S rRNA (cytosine(1402)-N(4))-methyltransferase RsmH [Luteolibacter yonseiensis]|uniref:Ribosomal RNA small subunit methyltransferase H n=1 Tax=Luteolibacter yonseiensis TaxID=1144680 RepID=A0A934V6Z5_9BACT|nr:16S rRNA (cytosine(1402)-N(4))-methyltransferase RsmH [Luteolibacter yonseiensis]MBK1815587.1 16S rRNA (cytosine(1402)-N(4))-methyltransferase RsmH [Luteolibacter yonseiensis]